MQDYDVIIVGAGVAGCAAAFTAAKAGLKTLTVERGKTPGAKNVTGGRLYAHSLEKLIPGFASEAPVERCVTRERLSFMTDAEAVTIDYAGQKNPDFAKRSYTVLRAKFDEWLWSKAAALGAELLPSTRVNSLIKENGAFCGIETAKDIYRAPVIILADGVNSILAQRAGIMEKPTPDQLAIGVKEVIRFSPDQMRDRFQCVDDQGMAWLFAGAPTNGNLGGGFLYTNRDSISIGLVLGMGNSDKSLPPVQEMLKKFKSHPAIAPLLDGGETIRYPGHIVPEGGIGMMPQLTYNGLMIAGDAAGMCVNIGYTIRGMDFAIAAGRYAAETAIMAHKNKNYTKDELDYYYTLLNNSFVLQEMRLYADAPHALNNSRVFNAYPRLACGFMNDMFTVDGKPKSMLNRFWNHAWDTGVINLVKDGFQILRSI